MNRAQEPRLRGGSSVAGVLHTPAGLVSERTGAFSRTCLVKLTRMEYTPAYQAITNTGLTLNANNSVLVTDTTLAAVYLAEFEEMWAGHAEWQRLWSALGRDRSETRFLGVSQAK